MTSGVPWQVEGVGREARESAREAARRSGMSVGEWLDSVISDRAHGEQPKPPPANTAGAGSPSAQAGANLKGPSDQGRQIDQLSRLNAAKTYLRPGLRRDEPPSPLGDVISQLDRRLDQLLTPPGSREGERQGAQPSADRSKSLELALLEIGERQRALQAEAEPTDSRAPSAEAPSPAPSPDLSHLEQQLRRVTTRIETLRPCGVDEALETLRDDLAEIGLMLKEAVPRQAIEALEAEIRRLSERLELQRSPDAPNAPIAGIERGLAEVRDALRTLTPAESLAGVEETVRELAHKIDRVASHAEDPAALTQLEGAIVALRGITTQVASDDVLTKLSDEVHGLAAKVDQIASSANSRADLLSTLEQRLASVAQTLEQRPQTGAPMPGDVDAVVRGITDRLEALGRAGNDPTAFGLLEERITSLVERLDKSNARFDHLEAIERGLADMMAELERQRQSDREHLAGAASPYVTSLRQEVLETKNSLESVQGAVEQLVDRLAMIESDMHGAPGGKPAARPASGAPTNGAAATTVPSPLRAAQPALAPPLSPAEHRPIDPNLPPDHPLEPGATRGRTGASPADRIAASEAALGATKPPSAPEGDNKSNFIAAARRAAQAASNESAIAGDKRKPAPAAEQTAGRKDAGGWGSRVRSLLVAVSVVLIVLSSVHLAVSLFLGGDEGEGSRAPEIQSAPTPPEPAASGDPSPDGPSAPAPTASPPGRQTMIAPPFETPAAPATVPAEAAQQPPPALPVAAPAAEKDVTGSIPRAATAMPAPEAGLASPAHTTRVDRLPTAIGGALRSAAAKGDAAAEYEIAQRFAEGRGVPENLAEAADWYDRAAKQGLPIAQFRLGAFYEKGFGVKKDLDMARRLYTAAAEAGNAKAMHNLAVLYAEGIDGKPDYQNAAKWFRKAADYGLPDSQYNLGILYGRGIGMPANLPEAYKWFSLAAREGDQEATSKRDDVGRRLDAASLAAATAAAQGWTALEQPEAATQAPTPPGGWDAATVAINPKPRAGTSKPATPGR